MKAKFIISILVLLANVAPLLAQTKVGGKVTDEKGQPVIGAVVLLNGAENVGTITDENGRYSLDVVDLKKDVLTVKCLSYKDLQVNVSGRSKIDIVLEDDAAQLDEVVVVGYGAMRRSDITGAMTSIDIDEDVASRSATLDKLLEGKAAGMQVLTNGGEPDSGVSIRIRGIGTFTGQSDPLYVVDGIIINGESEAITTTTQGYDSSVSDNTNGLSGINPQDIASIEVLKDASATAIYGSQGANGVVLITTKTANRDKPQITFNAGVSVNQRMNRINVCTFDQYVGYLEKLNNTEAQRTLEYIYDDPATHTGLNVTPVDWQDYMTRTSVSQRYYVSVAGRPKTYNYMFSIGYNHNEGILKSSSADNLTMRLNLDKNIGKKLKIGFKGSFGYTYSNLVSGATAGSTLTSAGSVLRSMLSSRPFITADDDPLSEEDVRYGPNRWLTESKNVNKRFRVTPSVYLQWKIIKSLTFKSTFGADLRSSYGIKTKSEKLSQDNGNLAGIGKTTSFKYNWDNLLTWQENFGRHNITATLGQSLSSTMGAKDNVQGWHLAEQYAEESAINFAEGAYSSRYYSEWANSLLSFFVRAIYNYDNRYVLTATYRLDGSSRFQGANKWSSFPSFAFAWRLADEPWFSVPCISAAKIRLGWGLVGNQAISNYQTLTTYSDGSVGDHYVESQSATSVSPGNIANPNLKWETTMQYNAGLDMSFWKGRLTFSFDAYRKDTRDLLQDKYVAYSTGFTTIAMNDGSIRNEGLELAISGIPFKNRLIEWSIGGNIAFNKNTILSVGESGNTGEIYLTPTDKREVNYFVGDKLQSSGNISPLNIFIEGQPMGLFYGFIVDGIVQEGETGPGFEEGQTRGPGYIKYRDLDGNGYIDDRDKTIIGNPLPKFTYGFDTSFSIKWFTLSASFSGVYGNQIFNLNNMVEYGVYTASKNVSATAVENAWTPQNKSNVWPGIGKINDTQDGKFSTRTVEDGSYLKMSNLSLSFAVPLNKKKTKFIKGLDLTFSCSNVFIASNYTGWSPTNNSFGTSIKRMGVDLNSTPVPRTYNFDVKFMFQ